ncbi:MAG TPA: hydrolase, partial [Clostridiales bacterium]|nr:hydrolase [Clostridiales bacterium]
MNNTERFLSIYQEKIHREGADKLLDYLRTGTDFFTAPASTRYHGAHEGGLLEHSLNVYDCLCDILARPRMKEVYGLSYSDESIAIVSLLHDVCKTNFYKV